MSLTNFRSILIFASCVVGTRNIQLFIHVFTYLFFLAIFIPFFVYFFTHLPACLLSRLIFSLAQLVKRLYPRAVILSNLPDKPCRGHVSPLLPRYLPSFLSRLGFIQHSHFSAC